MYSWNRLLSNILKRFSWVSFYWVFVCMREEKPVLFQRCSANLCKYSTIFWNVTLCVFGTESFWHNTTVVAMLTPQKLLKMTIYHRIAECREKRGLLRSVGGATVKSRWFLIIFFQRVELYDQFSECVCVSCVGVCILATKY